MEQYLRAEIRRKGEKEGVNEPKKNDRVRRSQTKPVG
jgi:hypothetical protein